MQRKRNPNLKKVSTSLTLDILSVMDETAKAVGNDRTTFLRVALLEKLARMGKLSEEQTKTLLA